MSDNIAIVASENLNNSTAGTGHTWKAVDVDGTIAATSGAIGILQNAPKSGEEMTVCVDDQSRFVAAAAVAAGARLTVTASGYMITAGSGDIVCGRNLETAVGSGGVGLGIFDFASAAVAVVA